MTQEGLSELVGIHWKTLGYIEAGKRDSGVTNFTKLVLTLKVSPEQILQGLRLEPSTHDAIIKKATSRKRRRS